MRWKRDADFLDLKRMFDRQAVSKTKNRFSGGKYDFQCTHHSLRIAKLSAGKKFRIFFPDFLLKPIDAFAFILKLDFISDFLIAARNGIKSLTKCFDVEAGSSNHNGGIVFRKNFCCPMTRQIRKYGGIHSLLNAV